MTIRDISAIRVKHDYKMMQNMKGSVIDFTVDNENDPRNYVITFHIHSIIGEDDEGNPIYRDVHTVDLKLPPDYPQLPPRVKLRECPMPYHVNWYLDGCWDYGRWEITEPLWSYVRRLARTLQFAPEYTNISSPCNHQAAEFWKKNRDKDLFPCDKQEIPVGDCNKPRLIIR